VAALVGAGEGAEAMEGVGVMVGVEGSVEGEGTESQVCGCVSVYHEEEVLVHIITIHMHLVDRDQMHRCIVRPVFKCPYEREHSVSCRHVVA